MSKFDDTSVLFKWATHDSASFHNFDPEEAILIRQSLLDWYYTKRRKLPWRGDPPPYDGSTAGTNDVKKATAKESKNQTRIQSFFESKSKVQQARSTMNLEENASRFPVSAYGIWVSEIMLQQTRVEAVIPFYLKWMQVFPTIQDLANATDEAVNSHWAGLGFYRRARLLHKGAKLVVAKHGGELPRSVKELMGIDGIGQYTASAIASIAFGECVPVVDGNVCRVLCRLRGIANHIKAPILKDKLGWSLAEQIVKAGNADNAGDVNQALMELGATYCAPSGTGFDDRDPLKSFYLSTMLAAAVDMEFKNRAIKGYEFFPMETYLETARTDSDKCCALCSDSKAMALSALINAWNSGQFVCSHGPFPLPPPKAAKREDVLVVAVLSRSSEDNVEQWLLVKRPQNGLLAGQWEFPSTCVWSSADQEQPKSKKRKDVEVPFVDENLRTKALTTYLESLALTPTLIRNKKRISLMQSVDHIFSHVRHTMWVEYGTLERSSNETSWMSASGKELRWMSKDDMAKVGITSGVRKILKAVAENSFKKRKC